MDNYNSEVASEHTETCGICFEPIEGYMAIPQHCPHVFCVLCFHKWFNRVGPENRRRCPVCRTVVDVWLTSKLRLIHGSDEKNQAVLSRLQKSEDVKRLVGDLELTTTNAILKTEFSLLKELIDKLIIPAKIVNYQRTYLINSIGMIDLSSSETEYLRTPVEECKEMAEEIKMFLDEYHKVQSTLSNLEGILKRFIEIEYHIDVTEMARIIQEGQNNLMQSLSSMKDLCQVKTLRLWSLLNELNRKTVAFNTIRHKRMIGENATGN